MKNFQQGGRFGHNDGNKFGGRSSGGFGGGHGGSERGQMYQATCSTCHQTCEVPFRPSGERPVYCRDCFRKNDDAGGSRSESRPPKREFSESRDRDFGRSGDFEKQMFEAICAKCGDECMVPFKPTGEKPVYCRDCFQVSEKAGGGRSSGGADYKKDFEQLSQKMDTLLRRVDLLLNQQKPASSAKPEAGKAVAPVVPVVEKKKEFKKPEVKMTTKTPLPKKKEVSKKTAPKAKAQKVVKKPAGKKK